MAGRMADAGGAEAELIGRGFVGKFRGKVKENLDPLGLGRLRVTAPDVLDGEVLGWALPAVPYGGDGVGLFLIPPTGADVWVEFEQGDPDYPVWTGCFWPDAATPGGAKPPARLPTTKVLKTEFVTVTIQDAAGGTVTVETKAGMKLVMDAQGVELSTKTGASVKLTGKQVSVNQGALEVV